MTKKKLAERLNGRGIGSEITKEEELEAKNNGLLVLFGASDDLCELRGAIHDETGAYEGTELFIKDGNLLSQIGDDSDRDVLKKYGVLSVVEGRFKDATQVKVQWCKTPLYAWTFETDAPHETFDVLEGEEKYCQGIVIDLKELEA